jgi:hypothetical protein
VGNYHPAADRYFRAARITFARGDYSAAIKLCNLALSAAVRADDQSAVTRAQSLLDEIETAADR